MNVPRYWAKGRGRSVSIGRRARSISCWRWSHVSLADAQRRADERAEELARLFESGAVPDRYGYGESVLREEIIQTLQDDSGMDVGMVTRNGYGALVLNTSKVMFIDVDFPAEGLVRKSVGLFRRLAAGAPAGGPEDRGLELIHVWATHHLDLGIRIYRTSAGLRCVVTNRTFGPTQPQTIELMKSIGSDPLYVRLCLAQGCFRARLTPKPWRCRTPSPPSRFPWADTAAESRFRQWQAKYERSIQGLAVCRFLRHFGPTGLSPEIRPILDLHDQFTVGRPDAALA
jgi:hypothetical protein